MTVDSIPVEHWPPENCHAIGRHHLTIRHYYHRQASIHLASRRHRR
jgi:hypothetical protein